MKFLFTISVLLFFILLDANCDESKITDLNIPKSKLSKEIFTINASRNRKEEYIIDNKTYDVEQLEIYLRSQIYKNLFQYGIILNRTKFKKSTRDGQDFLITFCLEKNIDLFFYSPVSNNSKQTVYWIVKTKNSVYN